MKKIVISALIVLVLSACGGHSNVQREQSIIDPSATFERLDDSPYYPDIYRLIDKTNGHICYVTDTAHGASMQCFKVEE